MGYDRILVPTDGSEAASDAVDEALELAESFDAEVHVLYVVDTRLTHTILGGEVVEKLEREGEEATGEIVERAEESGLETRREVIEGAPSEAILNYAEENGIDLIVMGTHGRTGLEKAVIGSVTEKVVRKSSTPVMTVRSGDG